MAKWKPMKSAPKNENILLLIDGCAIEGGWDDQKDSRGEPYGPGRWDVVRLPSHGCGCCSSDNSEPTGWLPLPTLSTEEKA